MFNLLDGSTAPSILGYEVEYLMRRTKISVEQARDLIKRFGNDRPTLLREALALGQEKPVILPD
jgi:hypothetical protein